LIKAIETIYNGYRFRSRLEARWAVFFDALGVDYEYEPEGFELSCGRYLPDFFLKDFDVYVEVKPFRKDVVHHVGDGNKWERKCEAFRDETGKAILICYDDPSHDMLMELFAWDTTDSSGGSSNWEAMFKRRFNETYIVAYDSRADRDIYVTDGFDSNKHVITACEWVNLNVCKYAPLVSVDAFDPNAKDKLNQAKKAARQARFEYGETPKI
jgi:hypothetical protein